MSLINGLSQKNQRVVLSKTTFITLMPLAHWEVGVTENQILETLKTIPSDSERLEASEEEALVLQLGC